MGVEKRILVPGDGETFPQPRDVIGIQYTGYLLEKNPDGSNKIGKKYGPRLEDYNIVLSLKFG